MNDLSKGLVTIFTTPPNAPLPYKSEAAPLTTSTLSMLDLGRRSQYTHPPNGVLIGTPSTRTIARLAPLAPTPRNDTPCEVGLANKLPERRKRVKPGASRRTSSSTKLPEISICCFEIEN